MKQGLFVVIEGCDGAGTTVQSAMLVERLKSCGREVLGTCEPTPRPVGRLIRQALRGELEDVFSWEAMALLFAADRVEHSRKCIEPALNDGFIVVSDRYDLSSLTYQSLTSGQRGPRQEDARKWLRSLNSTCVRPDRTFVLDVSAQCAAQRREQRKGPPELFETTELQARLAALYRRAASVTTDPIERIDGERDVESVHDDIWTALQPSLSR